MFPAIFLFSFWLNFDKATRSFRHPFRLGENSISKISTRSFEWGTGAWVNCINSMYFLEMWTPYIEQFFPPMVEYTSLRKFNKHFEER